LIILKNEMIPRVTGRRLNPERSGRDHDIGKKEPKTLPADMAGKNWSLSFPKPRRSMRWLLLNEFGKNLKKQNWSLKGNHLESL